MIHNFWSFRWIVQRFKDKAEEYGIEVVEMSEYKTSSICIRCGSDSVVRRGRLFRCLNCGLEAHRDVVGVLNMATHPKGGMAIGLVAQPLLLRWDGMRWEGKSPMNSRPMNTLEARISLLQRGECQPAGPGLMYVLLPPVRTPSEVILWYDLTLPEKAGYIVSGVSLSILILLVWRRPEWLYPEED